MPSEFLGESGSTLFGQCFRSLRTFSTCALRNKHMTTSNFPEQGMDSSVRTATGYWRDGRGSIPGGNKRFFSTPQSPDRLRLTQPPVQLAAGTFSTGVKRLRCEADYSCTSSADINNGDSIPQIPRVF
jgi:hypothetical protein